MENGTPRRRRQRPGATIQQDIRKARSVGGGGGAGGRSEKRIDENFICLYLNDNKIKDLLFQGTCCADESRIVPVYRYGKGCSSNGNGCIIDVYDWGLRLDED